VTTVSGCRSREAQQAARMLEDRRVGVMRLRKSIQRPQVNYERLGNSGSHSVLRNVPLHQTAVIVDVGTL
jgi:hypothetical protein